MDPMDAAPLPPAAQRAALLDALPPEDRAIFAQYYQRQLQAALRDAEAAGAAAHLEPDPDAVEADLIAALIRAAEGRDHPEGLGVVPSRDGAYEIVPPLDDPRTQPPPRQRRWGGADPAAGGMSRQRWLLVGALMLLPLLWLIWSLGGTDAAVADAAPTSTRSTPAATVAATPTPLPDIAGGGVELAAPVSLELGAEPNTTILRVLASAAPLGGTWEPPLQAGVAAWLNGSFINHVFCVGPESAAAVTALTRGALLTLRPASGAVRRYQVVRVRDVGRQAVEVLDQRRAGLTLIVCGQPGNTRTIVEAAAVPPAASAPPVRRGTPVTLPGLARLTLETVRVLTPTASLPSGTTALAVTLTVTNLTDQPWTSAAMADQLVVEGVVAEALALPEAAIAPHATGQLTYRYRVPSSGGDAQWRATAPTGETSAIALTVPPVPTDQPAPFTATLDAAQAQLEPTRRGQTLTLPLTVTAHGPDAVLLTAADAQVWVGGRSLPLDPATVGLPATLAPEEPTPLTLVVALPDVAQLEVQLGSQRWRVTLP